ncbi:MAG: LuxR C-terminal-related transcriptional regulator [Actinomycetota bacterium]|nr:LuxR C-terminal-related transcriptional regulator [Actinomycetota bacterium]
MATEWPLTGRGEELRLIHGLGQRQDGPSGVVVAGPAGVGKTRLAREALTTLTAGGAAARWVNATESTRSMPLAAMGSVVGLPTGAQAGPAGLGVVRAAAEAVVDGLGPANVVLGVDDSHLLDELSAAVVHHLVLHENATVVLTLRSGERAPDAVTRLWKDRHLERLELQPLSVPETVALLEAALGGVVDSTTGARLCAITGGNPLYLRHLVEGEREAGRLSRVRGVWRWVGDPRPGPDLTELVEARIGTLSDAERDVVDVLALAEPLDLVTLNRLTDPAAVERVEDRRIVDVVTDDTGTHARLAHPLYGEVRRDLCGWLRARRLRGRIARRMAETGAAGAEDLLRRAVLTLDSDLPADPELLTAGASRAAGLLDMDLAERLARGAVAAGGGFEPRFTLASLLVGRARDADDALADLLAAASTDDERVRASVLRVMSLVYDRERADEARAILSEAVAAVRDPNGRGELTAQRAVVEAIHGDKDDTIAFATAALDAPQLSATATAYACYAMVVALVLAGRADEAEPFVARGVAAALRSGDHAWLAIPTRGWQVEGQRYAGRLARAAQLAAEARVPIADEPLGGAIASLLVGHVELARGRARTALRWIREAKAGFSGYGDAGGWYRWCLIDHVVALAVVGDPGVREALHELDSAPRSTFAAFDADAAVAAAWVEAAEGAVTAAVTRAREAAEVAAAVDQPAQEMLALHTAVCFGDRTAGPRLAELAIRVDGPRAAVAARHAAALARQDGDALLEVSVALEELGALLLAADAAAQAVSAHASHDHRSAATAAAARARRLREECEGGRTPALIAATRPLPLTDRELEVVMLAAAGLSNRAIAERLVVSVRTVEGHVYRACVKLDVTDRAHLAELVRDES